MAQNVQYNEMNDLLMRTNQKLSERMGFLQNDLSLAHSQIDMLQEQLQFYMSRCQELEKENQELKEQIKPNEQIEQTEEQKNQ